MPSLLAHLIGAHGRDPIRYACVVPSLGPFIPHVRLVRTELRFRTSHPHSCVANLTTPRPAQMGHVGA